MSSIRRTTIYHGLADIGAATTGPRHIAVGMFDGVHRGHQAVIRGAVELAQRTSGAAGVLTFWPHPSRLFRPENPTRMIFSAEQRRELIETLGVDFIIEQPFTRDFAAIEAGEFLPSLTRALPGLETIFVGENWRFGHGRRGDVALLKQLAPAAGVKIISLARLHFGEEAVSSTRIREALQRGDIGVAADLLGFPYFATGRVVHGRHLGRTIGFPTLNLDWQPDLQPALGVYAVRVRAAGSAGNLLPGVANFGVRPTVDGAGVPVLEVHVLGECPFGVGDALHVDWLRHLRPEQKFSSIDDLRAQIARDRDAAQHFLAAAS